MVSNPVLPAVALPELSWTRRADVVVVGAGIAGLTAAHSAARSGLDVMLVCKTTLGQGASRWAQGGIAAAVGLDDSPAQHASDTITAGAGHCDENAVRTLTASAPGIVAELLRLGVDFDVLADGGLALAREGGHSRRRVVHAGGDATGAAIVATLLTAMQRESVTIVEHAAAVDAVLALDGSIAGLRVAVTDVVGRIVSAGLVETPRVVLATGGLGQLFVRTTNPREATGDGVALAARAGATIHDLEFVQFHPTALVTSRGDASSPLLTEALRGEGATIIDAAGEPVMASRHPLGDLAPRDVVSTIMTELMIERGLDNLWLDLRPIGADGITTRFPTVAAICARAGLDPTREPVPIAPAAHYSCGGVTADLDGHTSIAGLYAVGEVACTGVHGANRLASNGLLEAVLTGSRVAASLADHLPGRAATDHGAQSVELVEHRERLAIVTATSRYAGPLRTSDGLRGLVDLLAAVPTTHRPALDLADLETTNAHLVSTILATSALARDESRGCHRRTDVTAVA